MATKDQVRDRAAQDLGILRLNGSLQHEHKARLEAAYDEVHADLEDEGIAVWALSGGSVPAAMVPYVATLVAWNCRSTYALSVERYNRLLLSAGPEGETAKRHIRRLARQRTVSSSPVDF